VQCSIRFRTQVMNSAEKHLSLAMSEKSTSVIVNSYEAFAKTSTTITIGKIGQFYVSLKVCFFRRWKCHVLGA